MSRSYGAAGQAYAGQGVRDRLRVLMRREDVSQADIAYELRISRSHVSGMFTGLRPMGWHYVLAIKFVLLQRRSERKNRQRQGLFAGDSTLDAYHQEQE